MPFGPYKDFDDCVKKNQDKRKPKAYCAAVERKYMERAGRKRRLKKKGG